VIKSADVLLEWIKL